MEEALTRFRDTDGLSVSTVNAYRTAAKQFTSWMYRNGLAAEDPLRRLSRQKPEPHRRCKCRALTREECSRLLQAAYDSDCDHDGASPGTRALLYRTGLETGLRFNELKTLKVHHLDLDGTPPTVTVEGGYSKSGRTDVLPLRKSLPKTSGGIAGTGSPRPRCSTCGRRPRAPGC